MEVQRPEPALNRHGLRRVLTGVGFPLATPTGPGYMGVAGSADGASSMGISNLNSGEICGKEPEPEPGCQCSELGMLISNWCGGIGA